MQLFLTIYTFIFQSGIKVLIAVAEKHKPPRWEWRLADAAEKQPLCSPACQWIGKNRVTGEHLPQFWSSLFTVPRGERGRGVVVWGPADRIKPEARSRCVSRLHVLTTWNALSSASESTGRWRSCLPSQWDTISNDISGKMQNYFRLKSMFCFFLWKDS